MIQAIKNVLASLGLMPVTSFEAFETRRSYHLSMFTDLIDRLESDNAEIAAVVDKQIKEQEKLKEKIKQLDANKKQLTSLVSSNMETINKISKIF